MPLPASGTITLYDVAAEFGGATPHTLQEYYGAAAGIPEIGQISLFDFYGASAVPDYSNVDTKNGSGGSGSGFTVNYGPSAPGRKVFAVTVTRYQYNGAFQTYLRSGSGSGTIISNGVAKAFAGGGGYYTTVNLLDITAHAGTKTTDTLYLTGSWQYGYMVYFFAINTSRTLNTSLCWVSSAGSSNPTLAAFPSSAYRTTSTEQILIACSSNTGGATNPQISVASSPYDNTYTSNSTGSAEYWLEHSALFPTAWLGNYNYSATSSSWRDNLNSVGITLT